MSLEDLLREWTIVQGKTWFEVASNALFNLGLPIENVIFAKIVLIYLLPPDGAVNAWLELQDRLLARPPDTALVNITKPKEAHQKGTVIVYMIDKV